MLQTAVWVMENGVMEEWHDGEGLSRKFKALARLKGGYWRRSGGWTFADPLVYCRNVRLFVLGGDTL